MTQKLVFFIADDFQALDLFGPLDAFMETNAFIDHAYQSKLLSLNRGKITTAYGQQVFADYGLEDEFDLDNLIICGGVGIRNLILSNKQTLQLRAIADKAQRVISICTGSFILAQLYRDKQLTVTTHWRHCDSLAKQAKHCNVLMKPLFIEDQHIWSSAGVLSGVDLALELIRYDHGNAIAAKVAKDLVVYLQRSSQQTQFSELLAVQTSDSVRLSPLIDWLSNNLHKAISVTDMADYCCVSQRQLTRLFKIHLNNTPSQYLKKLRLDRARDLLSLHSSQLTQVAKQVGFNNYDSFRRAFSSHFGVSPSHYLQNN